MPDTVTVHDHDEAFSFVEIYVVPRPEVAF